MCALLHKSFRHTKFLHLFAYWSKTNLVSGFSSSWVWILTPVGCRFWVGLCGLWIAASQKDERINEEAPLPARPLCEWAGISRSEGYQNQLGVAGMWWFRSSILLFYFEFLLPVLAFNFFCLYSSYVFYLYTRVLQSCSTNMFPFKLRGLTSYFHF